LAKAELHFYLIWGKHHLTFLGGAEDMNIKLGANNKWMKFNTATTDFRLLKLNIKLEIKP
jgi:hypothetical protein